MPTPHHRWSAVCFSFAVGCAMSHGRDPGADAGSVADAGSDAAEPDAGVEAPTGGFESGTRLSIRALVPESGPTQFLSYFDNELGLACELREAADGRSFCVPLGFSGARHYDFRDPACEEPIDRVVGGTEHLGEVMRILDDHEVFRGRVRELWRLREEIVPDVVYTWRSGTCQARRSAAGDVRYRVLEPLAFEALVEGRERVIGEHDGFPIVRTEYDDGTWRERLAFADGDACEPLLDDLSQPTLNDETARCAPSPRSRDAAFADAACSSLVFLRDGGAKEPRFGLLGDALGSARFFRLDAPVAIDPVWVQESSCHSRRSLGRAHPVLEQIDAPLPELRRHLPHYGRLTWPSWIDAEGRVYPTRGDGHVLFFDREYDDYCAATLVPGEVRCVPRSIWGVNVHNAFGDASCTVPAARVRTDRDDAPRWALDRRDAPSPDGVLEWRARAVFAVGERIGPAYQQTRAGACIPDEGDDAYAISPIEWDVFALLRDETR